MTAAVHANGHNGIEVPGKWHPGGPGRPPNAILAAAKKAGTTKIGRRKKGGKAKAPKTEKGAGKATTKKPAAKKGKTKRKRASVQARMSEVETRELATQDLAREAHKQAVAEAAAEDQHLVLSALTDLERGVGGLWFEVERFVRTAMESANDKVARRCSELMLHAKAFLASLEGTRAAAMATI